MSPAESFDIQLLLRNFTTRPGEYLVSWFRAKESDTVSTVLWYLPLHTGTFGTLLLYLVLLSTGLPGGPEWVYQSLSMTKRMGSPIP
jgi:hypothetical protein